MWVAQYRLTRDGFVADNAGMDEFEKLRSELLAVTNISALAREAGLSRRQIQRIRGGKVPNTTLKTMTSIRKGIVALRAAEKRAA